MMPTEQNDRLLECLRLLGGWKPQAYQGMRNAFEVRGDVTAISMRYKQGQAETIVDTEDLPLLLPIPVTWCPNYHWRSGRCNAVSGQVGGKTTLLHRVIMGSPAGRLVDHVNRDPLDNRRGNLRIGDNLLNAQNHGPLLATNSSGYRGVSYSKAHRRWAAYVELQGRKKHLGYYDTAEEAAQRVALFRAEMLPWSPEAAAILAAVDGAK